MAYKSLRLARIMIKGGTVLVGNWTPLNKVDISSRQILPARNAVYHKNVRG